MGLHHAPEQIPDDEEEDRSVHQRNDQPGDGIGNHQVFHGFVIREDPEDPSDPENAHAHHGDDGGFDGMAQTAERSADGIHGGAEEIGGEEDRHPDHAPADDFGIGIEDPEQGASADPEEISGEDAEDVGAEEADEDAADDSFVFLRAVILSDETDGGVIEGAAGDIDQSLQTLRGRVSGDGQCAEGIDR